MPGAVNAWVYEAPEFIFPESNEPQDGALVDITVCAAESSFVHVTVLLTPITRVMESGLYPGGFAEFEDPLYSDTRTFKAEVGASDWIEEVHELLLDAGGDTKRIAMPAAATARTRTATTANVETP